MGITIKILQWLAIVFSAILILFALLEFSLLAIRLYSETFENKIETKEGVLVYPEEPTDLTGKTVSEEKITDTKNGTTCYLFAFVGSNQVSVSCIK